jgi:hypothetical protein
MPLLRLDGQGGNRAGFETLEANWLVGLLAEAIGALFDTLQCLIDLGDQLARTVASAKLESTVRLDTGTIGDVRLMDATF